MGSIDRILFQISNSAIVKRFLRILLISVLSIIAGAVLISYIAYHSFSPESKDASVAESNLEYFQDSYQQARDSFLKCVYDAGRHCDTNGFIG